MLDRSTLEPLPPLPDGVGDIMRCGGSRLADLLCALGMFFGSAGTGGASGAGDTASFERPGDGDLKVRSVMDPPLFCRCSPPLPAPPREPPPITLPLPTDDTDPRRTMRFVTKLPTGSGDAVWERRAAAAAALDREALEREFCRKAPAAATVAAFMVALSRGCRTSVAVLGACRLAIGVQGGAWKRTGFEDPRRRENMLGIVLSSRYPPEAVGYGMRCTCIRARCRSVECNAM